MSECNLCIFHGTALPTITNKYKAQQWDPQSDWDQESMVVADMVIETVEQNALETFPARYLRARLMIHWQDQIDEFHHRHLNNIERTINFTIEIEKNSQILFLDILLDRKDDGSIQTSV